MGHHRGPRRPYAHTSWDGVAHWYDGWVGDRGSDHHRRLVLPATLALLAPSRGERVLDVGCGQGVLAPAILAAGADYVGVDASPRLIACARSRHPAARFVVGDARRLDAAGVGRGFSAAAFVLSAQDMDPLDAVLASVASVLAPTSRVALVLTHPCFRVPRQSGWGWDAARALRYRRVDSYLSPLAVPWELAFGARRARTVSFHRPLQSYVNGLSAHGLLIDRCDEIAPLSDAPSRREADNPEIPVFLALRARRAQ